MGPQLYLFTHHHSTSLVRSPGRKMRPPTARKGNWEITRRTRKSEIRPPGSRCDSRHAMRPHGEEFPALQRHPQKSLGEDHVVMIMIAFRPKLIKEEVQNSNRVLHETCCVARPNSATKTVRRSDRSPLGLCRSASQTVRPYLRDDRNVSWNRFSPPRNTCSSWPCVSIQINLISSLQSLGTCGRRSSSRSARTLTTYRLFSPYLSCSCLTRAILHPDAVISVVVLAEFEGRFASSI